MISSVRCRASKRLQFPLDLSETYSIGYGIRALSSQLVDTCLLVDEKGRDGEWMKKYGGTRDFSVER